jgi:hypothetical protein
MSRHNTRWLDPDDDGSDAAEPYEAGQQFLKSLSRRAREAIERVSTAEVDANTHSQPGDESPLDGPQPKGQFYWRGKPCDFSRAKDRYKLLEALWDDGSKKPHAERDVGEVLDAVYGKDKVGNLASVTVKLKRLKNLRHHVRGVFLDKGIALDVECRGGKIWLAVLD